VFVPSVWTEPRQGAWVAFLIVTALAALALLASFIAVVTGHDLLAYVVLAVGLLLLASSWWLVKRAWGEWHSLAVHRARIHLLRVLSRAALGVAVVLLIIGVVKIPEGREALFLVAALFTIATAVRYLASAREESRGLDR
jgi:hypothetical protein